MKKYFFALGTNFKLSLAELSSLFSDKNWNEVGSVVFGNFLEDIDPKKTIKQLGGTIKIGEILADFNLSNRSALSDFIKKETIKNAKKNNLDSRFNFGFSLYDSKKMPGDFFKLSLSIKKELKKLNISSRIVTSQEQVLSSVVVEQNKLVAGGQELCFFVDKSRVFVGRTSAVQAFKDLSKRDFGRPSRDDHSGMLPPKLAQVMINLARGSDSDFEKKLILDPFCGSGTVLMEAYLLGFKNIIGSDLSSRAVSDSLKNLDWIINLKEGKSLASSGKNLDIFQSDALNLLDNLDLESIDYIVCEPYLGPQRGWKDFDEVISELNQLYSQSLQVFYKLLKKGGKVVMVWPQFRGGNRIWKVHPDVFKLQYAKKRGELVYGREGQKVWREIIILLK